MAAPQPKPGERIGSYRLTALLGRGGMASVYLAEHTRLSQQAAIKLLSPATAHDDDAVSRFLTEARLISEIDHPGVVQIRDVIEQQDPLRIAYVMEHVPGPTLRREISRRSLLPVEVARIGIQLADALTAIHARQVIHRDLKPSNILLTGPLDGPQFPLAKLADFGIAKAQDRPSPHKTATGLIIGTPTYMAPEQVSGEPVSPATDLYALGELLYEMFTGQRVFPEDQRTSLRMKLDVRPPKLAPLTFPGSGPILQLIYGCLEPDFKARPNHDDIRSVLQTIDAAPVVDPSWVSEEPATQLEHTATFAGPIFNTPQSSVITPLALDPVTLAGVLGTVSPPRPAPVRAWWPAVLGTLTLIVAIAFVTWAMTEPQVSQPSLQRRAPSAATVSPPPGAPSPPPKTAPEVAVPVISPKAKAPRPQPDNKSVRKRARPKPARVREPPAKTTPAPVHEDLMPW